MYQKAFQNGIIKAMLVSFVLTGSKLESFRIKCCHPIGLKAHLQSFFLIIDAGETAYYGWCYIWVDGPESYKKAWYASHEEQAQSSIPSCLLLSFLPPGSFPELLLQFLSVTDNYLEIYDKPLSYQIAFGPGVFCRKSKTRVIMLVFLVQSILWRTKNLIPQLW